MNNEKTLQRLDKELVLREATNNIALETSYCRHCQFNHYSNIGNLNCQKCGELKATAK